jgi:hypothetical protein
MATSLRDLSKPAGGDYHRRSRQHGRRGKPGRPPGAKNKATIERELRAEYARSLQTGRMLAVDALRVGMHLALEGVVFYAPFTADGHMREDADLEMFMRFSELLMEYAKVLAPFESAKLSSITLPRAPLTDQEVTVRVNIFNDRGEHLAEIVDGKIVGGKEIKHEQR